MLGDQNQVPVPEKIESMTHYGMHRHFTDAGCVLMFGGGMKRGHLHGLTADERAKTTLKPKSIPKSELDSLIDTLPVKPEVPVQPLSTGPEPTAKDKKKKSGK